jgi:phage shock protein PspC (stress-responsive transcriptional regulator)
MATARLTQVSLTTPDGGTGSNPDPPRPAIRVHCGVFPISLSRPGAHSGVMNTAHEYPASSGPSATNSSGTSRLMPLRRVSQGAMVGGVAAGVARSLGVDPLIVRVAFVLLALLSGAGIALYLAGLLLIPDEDSGQSLARQLIRFVSASR